MVFSLKIPLLGSLSKENVPPLSEVESLIVLRADASCNVRT